MPTSDLGASHTPGARAFDFSERSSGTFASLDPRAREWLIGGGAMGDCIRERDWRKSPLGPIDSWPQSLRTTVGLCLASNFPISLSWGARHVQLYNDGYWPICGAKHPDSMGQDFRECWASAWPAIGAAFERASAGETSYLVDQRMFLDRNGYLEETFFTFSFSPIRDETGEVAGLFHPVTETTSRMLQERRIRVLRDVLAQVAEARGVEEALSISIETLANAAFDLPFVLVYLIDAQAGEARLSCSTGLQAGEVGCPARVALFEPAERSWPLGEVVRSKQTQEVAKLAESFGAIAAGPYPESPNHALLLPISPPGCDTPLAVLVVATSSRLPLTEAYRAFIEFLASGITSSVAKARAREDERQRAEALAELDRAKIDFFSNVSHELRTPLTLILGPLEEELAERNGALPAARLERLGTAHRNAQRLLKLVNNLLDFSRLEAGRAQASYQATDLVTYTADLASTFRAAIEKARLTLELDLTPLPQPVFVDREMWEKIVLNLLSNAFKHTFQGGVCVRVRAVHGSAELEVEDSGVGIDAAALPQLFERFRRVRGAQSRTHEGTGIGLALVQELARLHGGSVSVRSEPGRGTVFTVRVPFGSAHLPHEHVQCSEALLPAMGSGAAAFVDEAGSWLPDSARNEPSWSPPDTPESDSTQLEAATDACARPHILLVDDNSDMRKYVARLLGTEYRITAVANGADALRALSERIPDLVLSDIMMPVLDGLGLLSAIRQNLLTRALPVILLSARANKDFFIDASVAGADDYVVKPFTAQELRARIRTHIELAQSRKKWSDELKRANEELEAFNYSVSHDLRTPLRAIDGFSRAILARHAHQFDDEGRAYFDRVRKATVRMGEVIDDLLSLSRISRKVLRRERVDLTSLAELVGHILREAEPSRHVELVVEPGLSAAADSRLLRIVFENLLGNCWKFTAPREHARVTVGQVEGAAVPSFFVADNGVGFDPAYAYQLFQAFRRLHSESEFKGSGIGLATVARIVARHGGTIHAEGRVGEGATVFFSLG